MERKWMNLTLLLTTHTTQRWPRGKEKNTWTVDKTEGTSRKFIRASKQASKQYVKGKETTHLF